MHANVAPSITDPDERVIIHTVLDITAERRREAAALRLAHTDSLTGLANRAVAFDRLGHAVSRARRGNELVSVLFLDLDGFKSLNDRSGHEAGDELLRRIAGALVGCIRDGDSVARLGGDEFLVVAAHHADDSPHMTDRLAERLLEAVAAVSLDEGGSVTASIGIARHPEDGDDVDDLVRKADVAMYAAKSAGGSRMQFYSQALQLGAQSIAARRRDLELGLDGYQVVPFYQPIIRAGDGVPVGVEVLARWRHPERGLVAPDAFIPLAEQLHLLDRLTDVILEQVVADAEALRAAAPQLRIAVNVAPSQLVRPELLGLVLGRIGADLNGWTFEVVESAALAGGSEAVHTLQQLRDRGAQTAIDDFGTGYNGVLSLKSFGFGVVKLDRAFLDEMGSGPTLLGAMNDMAHALGAVTVAEGVEDAAQARTLRDLGVDMLQGFHIARPMPGPEAAAWLAGALQ